MTLSPMTNLVGVASPDPTELERARRRMLSAGLLGPWMPAPHVLVGMEPLPGPTADDPEGRAAGLFIAHGADRITRSRGDFLSFARDVREPSANLEAIPGDFGLLHVDTEGNATIVRAPSGLVPFYWSGADGRWTVATTLALFLRCGLDEPGLDPLVNAAWAAGHEGGPPGRTFFAGVQSARRGTRVWLGGGQPKTAQWWDPRAVAGSGSPAEHADQLRDAVLGSMDRELDHDKPNLLALSGGVDSSALAALAAQTLGKPVSAYTLLSDDPEDRRLDERYLTVLEQNIPLGETRRAQMTPQLALELVGAPAVPHHVPQLYLAYLPEALSELPASVYFSGDLADHLFGSVLGRFDWASVTGPRGLAHAWDALPEGPLTKGFWLRHRSRRLLRRPYLPWAPELPDYIRVHLRREYRAWWGDRRAQAAKDNGPLPYLTMLLEQDGFLGMQWEVSTFARVRRCAPFISRETIELAYACHPAEHLVPGTKRMMRAALSGHVPAANLQRPDKGVGRPNRHFPDVQWTGDLPEILQAVVEPGWPSGQVPYFSALRANQLVRFAGSYLHLLRSRSHTEDDV